MNAKPLNAMVAMVAMGTMVVLCAGGCGHTSPVNTDLDPIVFDARVSDSFATGMSVAEVERAACRARLRVREGDAEPHPAWGNARRMLSVPVRDTSYLSNDVYSPGWGSLDFYFTDDALVAVRYADPNTLASPEPLGRRTTRDIPIHRAHRDHRVEPTSAESTP